MKEILAAREVGCKIVDGVGGYDKLASNSEFISQLVWDVEEKCSNRMLGVFYMQNIIFLDCDGVFKHYGI